MRRLFPALLTAAALAFAGAATAQTVLFKNFSEVQVTGAVTAGASVNSHALIIFNSDYQHEGISDLPVTANDAQAVRRLFEGMGYPSGNIRMVDNATKTDLKRAVFDFTARLSDESSVVVYYSGHGISFDGDSRNYIVPVDLDPEVQGGARSLRERIFKDRSVNFNDDVLGTIKLAGPKGVVVFYDACRNSPIATDDATKAVGSEASFVPAKIQGTAMFYSARPGQTSLAALDSENDANLSVYTRVLVSKLAENPTMRLSDLHAVVQSDVSRLAREKAGGHRQQPVFEDELDYSRSDHNEFCLATVTVDGVARCTGRDELLTRVAVDTDPAPDTLGDSAPPPAFGGRDGRQADIERLYWESVKDSPEPAEVQSYLDQYPQGFFAPIARLRVEKLQAAMRSETETAAEDQAKLAVEASFWNSVKDMDDPEMIRLYLKQYPAGQFSALAEARIAQIENAAVDAKQAQAARMYEQAQAADTQQAYEGYLNLYPAGEHASAARSHLSRMRALYRPSWCQGGAALNPAERTICENYELGRLDQQLNEAFVTARARSRTDNAEQSNWRNGVRDACGINPVCIAQVSQARIAQLQDAAYQPATTTLTSRYPACSNAVGDWKVQGVSEGDWLNVRAAASSSARVVAAFAFNDSGITVTGCQSNGWCQVRLGCVSGWAFRKYLGDRAGVLGGQRTAYSGTYSVTGHPMDKLLNVRSGPGTEFPVIGELPPDATDITVGDCQRVDGYQLRWCTVRHASGARGWAYGQYLANQWGQRPD